MSGQHKIMGLGLGLGSELWSPLGPPTCHSTPAHSGIRVPGGLIFDKKMEMWIFKQNLPMP